MASVSSSSSANQFGLEQLRLQQARRGADQAEATAQALRGQAAQAQREAIRANENARALSVQSAQAQEDAGQARQGMAAASAAQRSRVWLSNAVDQVVARQEAPEPATGGKVASVGVDGVVAASAGTSPSPVVNVQGQVTGKIINTTA